MHATYWRNTSPGLRGARHDGPRSEEHTSELQSLRQLVCRLLLEKKNKCSGEARANSTSPSWADCIAFGGRAAEQARKQRPACLATSGRGPAVELSTQANVATVGV